MINNIHYDTNKNDYLFDFDNTQFLDDTQLYQVYQEYKKIVDDNCEYDTLEAEKFYQSNVLNTEIKLNTSMIKYMKAESLQIFLVSDCILSIDPALSTTGFAIFSTGIIDNGEPDDDILLESSYKRFTKVSRSKEITLDNIPQDFLLNTGKITTSKKDGDDIKRIKKIISSLFTEISKYNIKYVIMEDGYVGNNSRTAVQLATLRGAILGAFSALRYKVYMMQPSKIRKCFGIGGNAKKEEVAKEVSNMFPSESYKIGPYSDKQNKNKTSDIYDAISIGAAWLMDKANGTV